MKKLLSSVILFGCTLLLNSCADLVNQIQTLQSLDSVGVGSVTFKPAAYHDPEFTIKKVDSVLGVLGTSSQEVLASQLKRYYPEVERLTNVSPSALITKELNNVLSKDSFFGSRYSDNPKTKINIEITSLGFKQEKDGDSVLDMELGLVGNVYVVGPTGRTAFTLNDVSGSSKLSTLIKAISAANISQFRGEAAASFAESVKDAIRVKY